jgi:hypothetical protein
MIPEYRGMFKKSNKSDKSKGINPLLRLWEGPSKRKTAPPIFKAD